MVPVRLSSLLALIAASVAGLAQESPISKSPLVSPSDIIALAPAHRDRWQHPKGNWEFKSDSITGSGDSRIEFRGPFQPPFTLEFRLQVLKGMRPRVHVGPVNFANEGYERTFALHPANSDGVPFSYEEGREYQVSLAIDPSGALLTIDGRKIMTASANFQAMPVIGFSGGDWWSPGATRYREIIIRPRAVAPAVPAPAVAAALPQDAARLREELDRDLAQIESERQAAHAKLAGDYAARLEALASALSEQDRDPLAAAARVEKARVESGVEIVEEVVSRAPFEVLQERARYLEKRRAAAAEFDARSARRAAAYLSALEKSAANNPALAPLIERERMGLPQASTPLARPETRRTAQVGGGGGGPFEQVPGGSALLSGLVLHTGDFAGHHVLVAVQPIFRTAGGSQLGTVQGVPRDSTVKLEAAEGYAVGGFNAHSGDRVDGLELVFMKIKPDGSGLDPADSYKSPWAGGKGGGGPVQIGGSGHLVVGIFGASGLELDSLGLIEQLPAAATGEKPRRGTVKEVSRENPAVVAVANITVETLAESASAEAGKWQHVPAALRGAKIHSGLTNKHLGVAEYKVTAPGRVYVACNYETQGNSAGGWTEERWMPGDFIENGWARVEGLELKSWAANRTFVLFTKELKAGETGRLRCNKYEPPYFITFAP